MAITAGMQPESAWIVHARSDFPHPFQFCCFQRRHGSYCAKLTWIWSGWPGQGLAKHIYTSGLEASWCAGIIGPGFWQRFCSSTGVPDSTVQNQPGSNSSGWLCQVLAKWIRSRSKLVCKNHLAHFWPMLPSQSTLDANRIWHVYWESVMIQCENTFITTIDMIMHMIL